jgi:hypothetical protein
LVGGAAQRRVGVYRQLRGLDWGVDQLHVVPSSAGDLSGGDGEQFGGFIDRDDRPVWSDRVVQGGEVQPGATAEIQYGVPASQTQPIHQQLAPAGEQCGATLVVVRERQVGLG